MFFIEFNKMLKVSLTNRGWNDYVGYWNWIKVCTLKLNKIHVPATVFGQVGAGKGYQLTLGQFLSMYSTLGDSLSPDPCDFRPSPRPANFNFSAKWEKKCFNETFNVCLKPRDLDQDAINTTHCANDTFLTDSSGRNWRRGGFWHAGSSSSSLLVVAVVVYW